MKSCSVFILNSSTGEKIYHAFSLPEAKRVFDLLRELCPNFSLSIIKEI